MATTPWCCGKFRPKSLSLKTLNLPPHLKDVISRPRGIILVTGPTGSGKSTTLAAFIDFLNANFSHHILTIEDPVEFVHPHKKSIVNQREVHNDLPDFSEGLRRALREDPDVILVGEMRDLETISSAISAAETGHLVLAPCTPLVQRGPLTGLLTPSQPHSKKWCVHSWPVILSR